MKLKLTLLFFSFLTTLITSARFPPINEHHTPTEQSSETTQLLADTLISEGSVTSFLEATLRTAIKTNTHTEDINKFNILLNQTNLSLILKTLINDNLNVRHKTTNALTQDKKLEMTMSSLKIFVQIMHEANNSQNSNGSNQNQQDVLNQLISTSQVKHDYAAKILRNVLLSIPAASSNTGLNSQGSNTQQNKNGMPTGLGYNTKGQEAIVFDKTNLPFVSVENQVNLNDNKADFSTVFKASQSANQNNSTAALFNDRYNQLVKGTLNNIQLIANLEFAKRFVNMQNTNNLEEVFAPLNNGNTFSTSGATNNSSGLNNQNQLGNSSGLNNQNQLGNSSGLNNQNQWGNSSGLNNQNQWGNSSGQNNQTSKGGQFSTNNW